MAETSPFSNRENRTLPSARERGALFLFIAGLLALSAAPYVAAWRASPPGWTYSGSSEASLDDYPTYLAKMRAGARGEWTYRSPYAPELESTL